MSYQKSARLNKERLMYIKEVVMEETPLDQETIEDTEGPVSDKSGEGVLSEKIEKN